MRQLIHLEELDLGGNLFKSGTLPSVVCELTALKVLDLNSCGLKEIPER